MVKRTISKWAPWKIGQVVLLSAIVFNAAAQTENADNLVDSTVVYGDAFGEDRVTQVSESFSFSETEPTPLTFNTQDVQRDIRVKFTTRYDALSGSVLNRTEIRVNGLQEVLTPFSTSTTEVNHEYIISRRDLRQGSNTLDFRMWTTTSSKQWGIKDISVEYIEAITLDVGSVDNDRYGSNQTPSRLSGLRANFDLPSADQDYGLSVVGWDIDNPNELEIFINGNSLGFIQSFFSGGLNSETIFFLDRSMLITGENQIEFVNQLSDSSAASFKEWGVQNLSINLLHPDLAASNVEVRSRVISSNKPFPVSALVTSLGQTASSATTLRFLVSSDEIITSSDTEVATSLVPILAAGSSMTISQDIQTILVNQGLFIGVCVDAVVDEVNSENNCSDGVLLEGRATVSPVIMLLLDDETPTP